MNIPLLNALGLARGRDRRSPGEIAADLDEEFAGHLAAAEAELVAAGAEPAAARTQARARFGDVDRIRSRCLRVALEDRIMIKRAHLAVTIVLAVATVVLAFAMFSAFRAQAIAREQAMVQRMMAEQQREKTEAVTDFLSAMIVAADPHSAPPADVHEILDRAAARVGDIPDEQVAERLREVIERARREVAGHGEGSPD